MSPRPDDQVWTQWLLIAVSSVVATAVAAQLGGLWLIFDADRTGISLLIAALYGGLTVWGGWRARCLLAWSRACRAQPPAAGHFHPWQDRLLGPHSVAWWVTGLVVRLGLLGTVIGFMLMLESLRTVETLAAGDVGGLIRTLGEGMGVSLTTTLAGLIASMGMGLQMLALDRAAERLLARLPRPAAETLS